MYSNIGWIAHRFLLPSVNRACQGKRDGAKQKPDHPSVRQWHPAQGRVLDIQCMAYEYVPPILLLLFLLTLWHCISFNCRVEKEKQRRS